MWTVSRRENERKPAPLYTPARRDLLALLNLETGSTGSPNRNLPVPPETTNRASRVFSLVLSINSACPGLNHGAWPYCGVTARHECRLDCFRVDDLTHCSLLLSWPGLSAVTIVSHRRLGVDSRTLSSSPDSGGTVSVISPPVDFQCKIPTTILSRALPRQRIRKRSLTNLECPAIPRLFDLSWWVFKEFNKTTPVALSLVVAHPVAYF